MGAGSLGALSLEGVLLGGVSEGAQSQLPQERSCFLRKNVAPSVILCRGLWAVRGCCLLSPWQEVCQSGGLSWPLPPKLTSDLCLDQARRPGPLDSSDPPLFSFLGNQTGCGPGWAADRVGAEGGSLCRRTDVNRPRVSSPPGPERWAPPTPRRSGCGCRPGDLTTCEDMGSPVSTPRVPSPRVPEDKCEDLVTVMKSLWEKRERNQQQFSISGF